MAVNLEESEICSAAALLAGSDTEQTAFLFQTLLSQSPPPYYFLLFDDILMLFVCAEMYFYSHLKMLLAKELTFSD